MIKKIVIKKLNFLNNYPKIIIIRSFFFQINFMCMYILLLYTKNLFKQDIGGENKNEIHH